MTSEASTSAACDGETDERTWRAWLLHAELEEDAGSEHDLLHLEADKDQTKITMPGATKDGLGAMPNFTYNGG